MQRKTKKILAMLLACMMVFPAAACGEEYADPYGQGRITILDEQ